MNSKFLEAVENRRSIYALSAESPIADTKIEEIIKRAVKSVPSAFNSQTGRVVLLKGAQHKALWQIVMDTLREIVPAEAFADTEAKIQSFSAAYGSILYFEEQDTVKALQEQFALYKDLFPKWSEHHSGMLQFAIWTALEDAGLGASLQHYNPLIDEKVKQKWSLPPSWKLIAQMPFGKITAAPEDKTFLPMEERFKVFS